MLRFADATNSHELPITSDGQAYATLLTTSTQDYGADNCRYTVMTSDASPSYVWGEQNDMTVSQESR